MKQVIIILAILFTGVLFSQTVRVVNNNPGAPTGANVYATFQAAVDAADPGDIIQITPSTQSYGDATITKKLTIYGVGWNPEKDFPITSKIGNIFFRKDGALADMDPSGSIVSGLDVSGTIHIQSPDANRSVGNLLIEKCKMSSVQTYSSGWTCFNIIIRNNYLTYGITGDWGGGIFGGRNVVVYNNVIDEHVSMNEGANLIKNNIIFAGNHTIRLRTGNHFTNNVVISDYSAQNRAFAESWNSVISNNIFFRTSPTYGDMNNFYGNTFYNNISYGSINDTMPLGNNTGGNNKIGVNPMFVNVPSNGANTWSNTYDFHLKANSPAKNAGNDGKDMGIYGGSNPFIFSQTGSTIPVVQSMILPSTVVKGQQLEIKVKARGY